MELLGHDALLGGNALLGVGFESLQTHPAIKPRYKTGSLCFLCVVGDALSHVSATSCHTLPDILGSDSGTISSPPVSLFGSWCFNTASGKQTSTAGQPPVAPHHTLPLTCSCPASDVNLSGRLASTVDQSRDSYWTSSVCQ